MERLPLQTTFLCFILIFGVSLSPGNAHGKGAVRRQYLGSPDGLLSESNSNIPAPIVLPSGVVPEAGAVAPAGAIAPAPLIAPAPAILPANAIKEKNRATPTDEGSGTKKRFELPFSSDLMSSPWNGGIPQEQTFPQGQVSVGDSTLSFSPNPMSSPDTSFTGQNQFVSSPTSPDFPNEMFSDASNRDQLSSTSLPLLQGQYNSHYAQSAGKVADYFEPNEGQGTPPYLDSTFADTGPSKDDLQKIQPLLESENYLTSAIIKDSWKADNALASSRQAVSESLTTAHQLANVDWKNKPVVQEKPLQQNNNNNNNHNNNNYSNDLSDEARLAGMHKQDSSLSSDDEENLPQRASNSDNKIDNDFLMDQELQARLASMQNQESSHSPTFEENHSQQATDNNVNDNDNNNNNGFHMGQAHLAGIHKQESKLPSVFEETVPKQSNNNNNLLLKQARLDDMHKQGSPQPTVIEGKLPPQGINDDHTHNNNHPLKQSRPADTNKQESSLLPFKVLKPTIKATNHVSPFLKTDQGLTSHNTPSQLANSTRPPAQSLASFSSALQNHLLKTNVSESGPHNEWFTNATLAKSNSSLENRTASRPTNDLQSKKLYTAADYLQTLYPQLSVFKASPEGIKDNASLLLSLLHDNGTSPKLISVAPKLHSKDVLGQLKNAGLGLAPKPDTNDELAGFKNADFGSNKITGEVLSKAQQELLMSLMKADSMLGERSSIKQNRNTPRYIPSSKLLLTRSKKPGKQVPGYRYLTEYGAKLLPAHLFSPLGSEFKDPLEPSSTPAAKTSISTTPVKTTGYAPLILPTQAGQIQSQTQSHAGKEPSTAPVVVPTQSGMIASASKASEQDHVEGVRPTSRDNMMPSSSEAFISPTMPTPLVPTKRPYVPTQSRFIQDLSSPVKTALPTASPFVPTQIGFIPNQKDNIWTGNAEDHSEGSNINSNTRLPSHETKGTDKGQLKSGLSHFHEKPKKWGRTYRNSRPHLFNSRMADSSQAHSRERRQMFVPLSLMQTNTNSQQFGQSLLPGQLAAQSFLPNLPQIPQLQQPVQQFLPTQPLQGFLPQLVQSPQAMADPMSLVGQPDVRSQFPLQQALNQMPQALFSPQQNQDPRLPFGTSPGQLSQLSNSIGLTPFQSFVPDQTSPNLPAYPQNDMRSFGEAHLPPITVNVPMTAPRKIPSFLTASQVYRDFEDVNSRSHLSDDVFGGQISRGDVPRNDDVSRNGYVPEDYFPDEPKYDKFAYENDKKMWGIDDLSEDEGANIMRNDRPRKQRKPHYTSDDIDDDTIANPGDLDVAQSPTNLRYSTGGRRFHRPRPHHRQHWVNENNLARLNGKGIIRHKEGEDEEINDDGFHAAADETTENARKEDSYETPPNYHHPSKHHRPSLHDNTVETDQSEKSSSDDFKGSEQSDESTKTSQSESRESDGTESESRESETQSDLSDDSSEGHQAEETSSADKNEKHEELKDGLEESTPEELPSVSPSPASISLPKPASEPSSVTLREEIIKKLSRSAVMHLNFDKAPGKRPGVKTVQDESGNKNDADLVNGAEISNRTMGSCGRVAILKYGEVMYQAEHFTRKPTKAASIAMWVKSRKPGLVRWFDVGDNDAGSPAKGFRAKHRGGKLVRVPKNQWIHLAGTFDSKTGIARVYVNGKLTSETVGRKNKGLPDDFTATGIGQKFGDKFISFLDDVFMFDRVISPAEVRMLYRKCEFNRMVLHFGFQKVNMTTHQLMDQSGLDNNATINGGAHILTSGCDKCGACLDASSDKMPGLYLDGRKFHHKPTSAISIASWISLNQTKGRHSIFQAISNKNDEWHDIYNLEVVSGKLHWRHKNANSDAVFDVKTDDVVIPEGLWSHVTATYSSESGDAKIYVNGLLKASFHNVHKPKLNGAWGRMMIGGHLPDAKNFAGLLDEFFIYNWELDPSEVRFVLKYCADKPKLVSFTVRVPLFKRQRVQKAPEALKYL